MRYDGYRETLDSYNPASHPTPWKYQGRLDVSPDADQPLYDAGARFYAPAIGAFTQLDSYAGSAQAAWSLNRYLYAGANPTSMIDPDGHRFIDTPGSATGGYRLPPQRHNLVRGAYKEPTPRPTVYIPPAKKSTAAKQPPTTQEDGFDFGAAAGNVVHRTANVAGSVGAGLWETGGGLVSFGGDFLCFAAPWYESGGERIQRAIMEGDVGYLSSLPTFEDRIRGAADAFVKASADLRGENGPDAQDNALGRIVSFSAVAALPIPKISRIGREAPARSFWGPPKPSVTDPQLHTLVEQLYRPGAKIGNLGTGDAIRAGVGHIQKGEDRINELMKIVQRRDLSPEDFHTAQTLLTDLISAMTGQAYPGPGK